MGSYGYAVGEAVGTLAKAAADWGVSQNNSAVGCSVGVKVSMESSQGTGGRRGLVLPLALASALALALALAFQCVLCRQLVVGPWFEPLACSLLRLGDVEYCGWLDISLAGRFGVRIPILHARSIWNFLLV